MAGEKLVIIFAPLNESMQFDKLLGNRQEKDGIIRKYSREIRERCSLSATIAR